MNGNTALHHASRNVHVRLVQLLCNRGADVSARDIHFGLLSPFFEFEPEFVDHTSRKRKSKLLSLIRVYMFH